tara:strand:- start:1790 stop:1891 length:102 start_codon:yes stop_codon:yes gene_type:complete
MHMAMRRVPITGERMRLMRRMESVLRFDAKYSF